MKQLNVVTDNRPGILAHIATILGQNGINIESIAAETFPAGDGAVVKLITKDSGSAKTILHKQNYIVSESDVLLLEMLDRPGELGKIAERLSRDKVNIESIILMAKNGGKAILALKVDNMALARKAMHGYLGN